MPESVKRRGSSGPTIGATVSSSWSLSDAPTIAMYRMIWTLRPAGACACRTGPWRGAGGSGILRRVATCLVTGGAGFLGSHLCDELLARGNRVICVDNLETGSL